MRSTLIDRGLGGLAGRFLLARRLRAALTALGVTFGVALIVAMTVLGATLQESINEQLRQGFGTYDIMAGLDRRLMTAEEQTRLAQLPGVRYSVGILYLTPDQEAVRGVAMPYNYIAMGQFPEAEYAFPVKSGRRPGAAEFVAESRMADHLGLQVGDTTALPFATGQQTVKLVGILPSQGTRSSNSLLFDLAWLQQQMKLGDQVTLRVFGLDKGVRKDNMGSLMRSVMPEVHLELRTELDEVKRNMGGLKPMAVAFGVAGLFAAGFLVAGSFRIAVQERSRELAVLRAVGAAPRQVMHLVVREAVLLGALGSMSGVAAGWLLAWGALGAAATSLGVANHAPVVPVVAVALECLAGVGLAVVAAWKPARAAGQVAPLQAMRPDAQQGARLESAGGRAGLMIMAAGVALAAGSLLVSGAEASGLKALLGAVGGLLLTAGIIAALPRILPVVVSWLATPLARLYPSEALLAVRSVLRHRRRNALTAATLILGIMLTVSVTTVFGVLGRNQFTYVQSQFPADAQIEESVLGSMGADLARQVAVVPGVTGVAGRGLDLWGALGSVRMGLAPVDMAQFSRIYDFGRVQGDLRETGITLTQGQARRLKVQVGDSVPFVLDQFNPADLPQTSLSLKVAAVVERLPFGEVRVAVSRNLFPSLTDHELYFRYDASQRAEVKEAVRNILRQPQYGTLMLRDLADSLEESRQMVNQRWAILGAVVATLFVIAAFSLVNGVLTGLYQRQRELATLRAVGSTPAQTSRQVVLEAVLLGTAGSLLGLLAGVTFTTGVAMGLEMPLREAVPGVLALSCLLAGPLLAALASVVPARSISRGPVARVLQVD